MMPITSYFALIIILLGAVCISSGYMLVQALHRIRIVFKKKMKKGEIA